MHSEHPMTDDLQRLLRSGYSAEDLRTSLRAPKDQIEKALSQYHEEIRLRQHDRALHSQATYAMRLRRR